MSETATIANAEEIDPGANSNTLAAGRDGGLSEAAHLLSGGEFAALADNIPTLCWIARADGHIFWYNRRWYDYTGTSIDSQEGWGWESVHDPERLPEVMAAWKYSLDTGTAFEMIFPLRRGDGVFRPFLTRIEPFRDGAGTIVRWIGTNVDISERVEAESALEGKVAERTAELAAANRQLLAQVEEKERVEATLRQMQRLEAVGKLTGGVAHDFNNLLQVIGGNLQLLAKDVAGNTRAERRLEHALGGVQRGSKLASQLLAFGRRQPLAPQVVNLARFIRGLDDMLRRTIGEEIELETVIAGGLWNTFVDTAQLENAILNLAINARDAMSGRGKLTIEAGNASLDEQYAARHAEVARGQYVMIAVSDTGSGIPPEILESVFEPFFTTKPEGQGTGLGLSMVYGFAKQSAGHAKIYSEPGQGTTVRIYLPRSRQPEDAMAPIGAAPVSGGTETILVVEDDERVRLTVVDMLGELGYRVLQASDAQAALAVVESGVPIDLLFTDVVMPGPLRSPELARKTQDRLPHIGILFTSGYTDNAIVHGGRLDEGTHLLSKPYSREDLALKIRDVLSSRARKTQNKDHGVSNGGGVNAADPQNAKQLRILLVEDEPLIRASTAELIAGLGHEVLDAKDAASALKLLDAKPVDLLLTDVRLPGQSGIELAIQAREKLPGIKVVLATGYDRPMAKEREGVLPGAILLAKPYDIEALAKAIESFE